MEDSNNGRVVSDNFSCFDFQFKGPKFNVPGSDSFSIVIEFLDY